MKRAASFILAVLFCFPFCSCRREENASVTNGNVNERVVISGEVPEELSVIVREDLLSDAIAYGDCFFRVFADQKGGLRIDRYALNGVRTASVTEPGDEFYYSVNCVIPTSDGGFLYVRGYSEQYIYDLKTYSSKLGAATYIVKCAPDGEEAWRYETSEEGEAFSYCIEEQSGFLFFGTDRTTGGGKWIEGSDVLVTELSPSGEYLHQKRIGGSDFDDLSYAEVCKDGYLLYMSTQSTDGDFQNENVVSEGSKRRYYFVTVGKDLSITDKRKSDALLYRSYVGRHNGKAITDADGLFSLICPRGRVRAIVDYDGYYLVVSRNPVGIKQTPESVSAILYECETVYTGYTYSNEQIFVTVHR